MHTDTSANSIFDGPITNLLSTMCILIEILSCAHAKRGKGLNDFKFGTFIGRFQSDGAASMAVKWLKEKNSLCVFPVMTEFLQLKPIIFVTLFGPSGHQRKIFSDMFSDNFVQQ